MPAGQRCCRCEGRTEDHHRWTLTVRCPVCRRLPSPGSFWRPTTCPLSPSPWTPTVPTRAKPPGPGRCWRRSPAETVGRTRPGGPAGRPGRDRTRGRGPVTQRGHDWLASPPSPGFDLTLKAPRFSSVFYAVSDDSRVRATLVDAGERSMRAAIAGWKSAHRAAADAERSPDPRLMGPSAPLTPSPRSSHLPPTHSACRDR